MSSQNYKKALYDAYRIEKTVWWNHDEKVQGFKYLDTFFSLLWDANWKKEFLQAMI